VLLRGVGAGSRPDASAASAASGQGPSGPRLGVDHGVGRSTADPSARGSGPRRPLPRRLVDPPHSLSAGSTSDPRVPLPAREEASSAGCRPGTVGSSRHFVRHCASRRAIACRLLRRCSQSARDSGAVGEHDGCGEGSPPPTATDIIPSIPLRIARRRALPPRGRGAGAILDGRGQASSASASPCSSRS
jgi:hypothetical protein